MTWEEMKHVQHMTWVQDVPRVEEAQEDGCVEEKGLRQRPARAFENVVNPGKEPLPNRENTAL